MAGLSAIAELLVLSVSVSIITLIEHLSIITKHLLYVGISGFYVGFQHKILGSSNWML